MLLCITASRILQTATAVGLVLAVAFDSYSATRPEKVAASESLIERQRAVKPARTSIGPGVNIGHVVVKFDDRKTVRLRARRLVGGDGRVISEAESVLSAYLDGGVSRLFSGVSEEHLDRDQEAYQTITNHQLADLNSYYRIAVSDPTEAEAIINRLNSLDAVEIAYFAPVPELAEDIDPPTPDYQPNQDYREAAPAGVDADYANTLPGGDGTGVMIIDIEFSWQTTHEDLERSLGGLIGPEPGTTGIDHGTAVIGVMIGGDNGYGVTGICPGADIGMVSALVMTTAEAIYLATENLQPGDLILIELHAPGPHYDFEIRTDQQGYVCMEYWQANYDAIQYAWAKGITVIETAGNGAENLDDPDLYGQLFDTTYRNSHAIMVGAGYPAASSSNLQRISFSNYGARVNVQGYGEGVYTTGYGDLFSPNDDPDQYYTSSFDGTSAAAPVVAGAVACMQGYFKSTYGTFMTVDMIRDALCATGTPQLGDTTEHIGPRPDLLSVFAALTGPPSLYADPFLLDTSLLEDETAECQVWLHNRSEDITLGFLINSADTLSRSAIPDWLQATPISGNVGPADSVMLNVVIDATVFDGRADNYKGVLEITWGPAGDALDSLTMVPVFLSVACNNNSYLAMSSDSAGGPDYNWISAKDLGTRIPDGSFYNSFVGDPLDDGSTGPHDIGFGFQFYGQTYSNIYIGVNGGLSFTDEELNVNGYYEGLSIPGAPFSTLVAVFWSDLVIRTSSHPDAGIYFYRSPESDTLVIEWHRLSNFESPTIMVDFEVLLTRDGSILCQYRDVESSGLNLSALIGLQETGCFALQYFGESGTPEEHQVSDQEAVLFQINQTGCCVGAVGNVDCDAGDQVDLSDLTRMIDYLFISFEPLCCYDEANVQPDAMVDLGDLTRLIDYLFISFDPLQLCP